MRQAKVLRDKKLARMAKIAKTIRPTVSRGVVKYNAPVVKKIKEVQQFAAPPPPIRTARTMAPKGQQVSSETQQQRVSPQKVVRRQKGCSGCRRKIGGK